MSSLPPWGTKEALLWGIAHPDWPWHTDATRAEYEYPNGRWWVKWRAAHKREDVSPTESAESS